jgi:hypothetical protein
MDGPVFRIEFRMVGTGNRCDEASAIGCVGDAKYARPERPYSDYEKHRGNRSGHQAPSGARFSRQAACGIVAPTVNLWRLRLKRESACIPVTKISVLRCATEYNKWETKN